MSLSGRLVVRFSPELHKKLRREAMSKQISLNSLIVERCQSAVVDPTMDPYSPAIRNAFGKAVIGVIVFGSQVRRDSTPSSDIDLLIVLDSQVPIERSLYRQWDEQVASQLDSRVSPQFSHLPDIHDVHGDIGSLWLEISIEGQIFFERDQVVQAALIAIRTRIASGEYVRKFRHGHPYWVKNTVPETIPEPHENIGR